MKKVLEKLAKAAQIKRIGDTLHYTNTPEQQPEQPKSLSYDDKKTMPQEPIWKQKWKATSEADKAAFKKKLVTQRGGKFNKSQPAPGSIEDIADKNNSEFVVEKLQSMARGIRSGKLQKTDDTSKPGTPVSAKKATGDFKQHINSFDHNKLKQISNELFASYRERDKKAPHRVLESHFGSVSPNMTLGTVNAVHNLVDARHEKLTPLKKTDDTSKPGEKTAQAKREFKGPKKFTMSQKLFELDAKLKAEKEAAQPKKPELKVVK